MHVKKLLILVPVLFTCFEINAQSQEHYWTDTYIKATQQYWGKFESLSGSGSSKEQTRVICQMLPDLISQFSIKSILDVPCGDFNWMSCVDMGECNYIGGDIVAPMVAENSRKYAAHNRSFTQIDVTKTSLPKVDLIISRDLLVHLSLEDMILALKNFKKSGAKYLLTTTFPRMRPDTNSDIASGGWRTVNLEKRPFNFPKPLMLINENCSEQNGIYNDKSLGLWELADINV